MGCKKAVIRFVSKLILEGIVGTKREKSFIPRTLSVRSAEVT
jgi:hypothetical protein